MDSEKENSVGEGVEETGAQESGTQPPATKKRKVQFRFSRISDLFLITEVEEAKPFQLRGKDLCEAWANIAHEFNKKFKDAGITSRRVKLRFELLLKEYSKEDFKNRYASGTEEEKTAIKDKLSDLDNLIKSMPDAPEESRSNKKVDEDKAAAEAIREAALSYTPRRKVSDDGDSCTNKRSTEKTLLTFWKEKQDKDRDEERQRTEIANREKSEDRTLRREELEVEKQRIQLEKERLNLEKFKAEKEASLADERFQLEKQERLGMMKTQEVMLQLLLDKKK